MLYRMVRRTPLASGQRYGDIIKDGDLKPEIIAKFLASGTLVRVSMPPLSELPKWEKRAGILAGAGVITVTDLIEAETTGLAATTRKPVRIIKQWQEEASAWLNPPQDESG